MNGELKSITVESGSQVGSLEYFADIFLQFCNELSTAFIGLPEILIDLHKRYKQVMIEVNDMSIWFDYKEVALCKCFM